MTRLLIFMAVALCLWQEVQGQSPCLRLPGDITTNCTSEASRSFPLGPMNFTHINQTAGLSTPKGRYKAFWIMGDGNFVFTPDGAVSDLAADMATLSTTYSYHRQDKYDITAVLVEKKSNGQPPEPNTRAAQMDNVSSRTENAAAPAQPAGTPFNKRINAPDRADVLPSAKIRLGGATTALAISTLLPKDIIPPSVVLVFFNSVRATRSGFEKADLFVTDANLKVSKPNYADASFTKSLTSSLPASFITASDARGYRDVIAMPVSVNSDKRISSFTEFRFFPLLKTKSVQPFIQNISTDATILNTRAQGETQFLTLLLENAITDKVSFIKLDTLQQTSFIPTQISEAERARIYLILKTQFNELTIGMDTNSLRLANGMFVRGAYHQIVDIVASIDPTGLEVLSVCPKDNNKYEVAMKITVCNEGNVPEANVGVRIFNTKGIQILDPVFNNSNTLDAFLSNPTTSATVPSWSFNYKDLPGAYDELGQYADDKNCFDRTFSYKTDWAGVQALQTGKALTASVTFNGALINPTQDFPNAAFKEGVPVTPEIGYNCGPPKDDNCWWLYVILFALGLVAWWYWKMKKEEEGNSN